MTREGLKELVAKMTLEEKAAMCSGADFWHTEAVERLGIPAMMVSDGPHGLRKQDQEADNLEMCIRDRFRPMWILWEAA